MAMSWGLILFPGIALVLAILLGGLILLVRGIRGAIDLSEPYCAKCKYDLRGSLSAQIDRPKTCPECGADLAPRKAVRFGRSRRRPGLMIAGVSLILLALILPILLPLLLRFFVSHGGGPSASRTMSNSALIAHLASTIDQPWDWQELERRMRAGQLGRPEIDQTFDVLTADLIKKQAAGQAQQPLHWCGEYLRHAISNNLVTPVKVVDLHRAYYKSGLTLKLPAKVRVGQPIKMEIDVVSPWSLDNTNLVWSLKEIKADGSHSLSPSLGNRVKPTAHPDQFSGGRHDSMEVWAEHPLAPGDHELSVAIDAGTLSPNAILRGFNGKPGTADKWPNPIAQWPIVFTKRIQVVGKDEPVIDLITDPAKNPFVNKPLKVQEAVVRPASRGTQLVIKWDEFSNPTVPVSFHVTVVAGDQRFPYGGYLRAMLGRSSTSSIRDQATIPQLPAEITAVDLILTPDPKDAERIIGIDQIWGEPYEIKNVPLQRSDLPPAKN